MSEHLIELEIKDYRAIQKAKIALNGITVLSGENGCGKSTIAKLTYHSIQTINQYEDIIYRPLLAFYKKTLEIFTDISNDLSSLVPSSATFMPEKYQYTVPNIPKIISAISTIAQTLTVNYYTAVNMDGADKNDPFFTRLRTILSSNFAIPEAKDKDWSSLIHEILDSIIKVQNYAAASVRNRNTEAFTGYIKTFFNNEDITDKFNLYEYGVGITNYQRQRLLHFRSIDKVLYIDTPMAIGLSSTHIPHWDFLNETLRQGGENKSLNSENIYRLLSENILEGETSFDTKSIFDRFVYQRKDGLIINLLDCATGIKSFAILQILLKNGYLDNKTLLIIDEPEAHLHPQWIVEFARIITLLNKELGVKFLIASHNPDMISALKYISEKEKISDNMNFYLAEKTEEETYIYKALGSEIDEIFGSFNIAIDRINQYGEANNEIF
ncbi:MAG: hypothetical protein EGQ00_07635 [Parabacteroides johnsonii]|nr:hypothetical protein [Parabacteroides johnsonii]